MMMNSLRLLGVLAASTLLSAGARSAVSGGQEDAVKQSQGFDFLAGKDWSIENRVLAKRLVGSTEWTTFEAKLIDARKLLGGLASMDRFIATRDGDDFEGLSLRIYNPDDDEWTIYWADSLSAELREQVRGKFEDGVGTFYGEEAYNGRTYRMRFVWKDITDTGATWEQAYYDESRNEWETNWVMIFRTQS